MKTYLMKFDEKDKPTFFDEKDRVPYRALLSSIRKSNNLFLMTISVYEKKNISDKQKTLLNVLINLIATETGNDIKTIEETLFNNFRKGITSVNDMNNEVFNDFLHWTVVFCNEFFDLNITINDNDHFEVNKIR